MNTIRRKRKHFQFYFFDSFFQLFGLEESWDAKGDSDLIIVRGVDTSSAFSRMSDASRIQMPLLRKKLIERKQEPLIESYIESCKTKNKELYEETMKKLIDKYK